MSGEAEIVPSSRTAEVMREAASLEVRAAAVECIDKALAAFRLAAEMGIPPREVARRSALVTLTDAKEEERPLVLVVTESEDHLHEVVDTLRAPVSIRFKTVTHAPQTPRPELPAPAESTPSEEGVGEESPSSRDSRSSQTEGEPA